MPNIKELKATIISHENFKDLIDAYEEIAAIRVRRIKAAVLKDREFLRDLNDVFSFVRHSYNESVGKAGKPRSKKSNLFMKTNGRAAVLLLSPNVGLYGDIILNTFKKFIAELDDYKTSDIFIAGRIGKKLYEQSGNTRTFGFFELPDADVDAYSFKAIVRHLLLYDEIIVYHGIFENILHQRPIKTAVTGELESFFESRGGEYLEEGGIFEPSIEKVAAFFEKESLSILIEQPINEFNLSRFASRMINLDFATVNVNKQYKESLFQLKKLKRRDLDKKQLAVISSISLWKV